MSLFDLSSWRLCFSFLALGCMCASVLSSPVNITVTVPAGSSNHGSPNLICTPTRWYDIIFFFGANFFAHAATVKTLPGEKGKEVAFTIVLALLFPFSGISRGVEAIVRHASWPPADDLTVAARAGALCTFVRLGLKAQVGEIIAGFKLPEKESKEYTVITRRAPGLVTMPIVDQDVATSEYTWIKFGGPFLHQTRKLHGMNNERLQQSGYVYGILPSNTLVEPQEVVEGIPRNVSTYTDASTTTTKDSNIVISSSHNVPQILVAIVQVLSATVTLYRTKGDQLNRYGYAAFGLTVLPYLIMSIINLVGNLLTPTYSTLYMVNSYELRGYYSIAPLFQRRQDQSLQGPLAIPVVGRILQANKDKSPLLTGRIVEEDENRLLQIISGDSVKASSDGHDQTEMAADGETQPGTSCESNKYRLTWSIPDMKEKDLDGAIVVPACINLLQSEKEPQRWSTKSIPYWLIGSVSVLGIAPYAVIGALTRFQPAQSKTTQQVFTMYWLAVGLLIGAAMPFYKFDLGTFLALLKNIPDLIYLGLSRVRLIRHLRMLLAPLLLFLFMLLFSSAAIGGFIVVGQMLMEYGTCTSF